MNEQLAQMETLFLALADKTRLRLLSLMRNEEICVCYFTEILGEPQPKISRHLAYLRQAGLVETTREGKWIYYRLREPENENARRVLNESLNWLEAGEQIKNDRKRMAQVCCAPEEMPIALQRAPKQLKLQQANMLAAEPAKTENQKVEKCELADYLL